MKVEVVGVGWDGWQGRGREWGVGDEDLGALGAGGRGMGAWRLEWLGEGGIYHLGHRLLLAARDLLLPQILLVPSSTASIENKWKTKKNQ